MKKYENFLILFVLFLLASCEKEVSFFHDTVTQLSNDCIKRSLPVAPNIVHNNIEFAYAMAIPKHIGHLESAQVISSIAGAEGTHFDPNSYYTDNSGQDIPIRVAHESQTKGKTTTIQFSVDTCASTLRFYYQIPQDAKGKNIKFTFSVKANNGQIAEYSMGPYYISQMDMSIGKVVTPEQCYLSFHEKDEAIRIYSKQEIEANPELLKKIDLMYAYNTESDLSYSFYTASSPTEYMGKNTLPAGFINDTKMIKVYDLTDRQLSDLQYNMYIDDSDFQTLDMTNSINYILRCKERSGIWIETSEGKFRAFIYVNNTDKENMTISVKRYPML